MPSLVSWLNGSGALWAPTERRRATLPQTDFPVSELAARKPLFAETLDVEDAAAHLDAWIGLASRSLEPNPFMDPHFCLPAAWHLAPGAVTFILVWADGNGAARTLVAVCPVGPKPSFWPIVDAWFHDLSALGAPLLDRDHAEAALLAVLIQLGRDQNMVSALKMTAIERQGPTACLLEVVAARTSRSVRFLESRRRAVLGSIAVSTPVGIEALSRRRGKELSRQRRRLEERGTLRYESATEGAAVSEALDRFLVLEAAGWKGGAGTALAKAEPRAAFVRHMVEAMAARGLCRIDSLMIDDTPIAMGILLSSGDRQYFWKTAFLETHAALSPGVHFVLDLTRRQRMRPDLAGTDSCAVPDHPMIDRLWPDRLEIVDALIGLDAHHQRRFRWAAWLECTRGRARAEAKRLHGALKRRLRRQRSLGALSGRYAATTTETKGAKSSVIGCAGKRQPDGSRPVSEAT